MAFRDARAYTPAEAADPSSAPSLLAEMARLRPDLRPVLWSNPACPEELRGWMQAAQAAEAAGVPAPVYLEPVHTERPPRPAEPPVPVPAPTPAPASPAASTPAADPARRRRRRVLFAAATIAALVLGAAGGGFVAGWTLSGEIEARKPATENTVVEVEVPSYSSLGQVPMPDIRGLDEAAAREVLADAGIPPEVVAVSTREAAGQENVVVEQTPAFGTTNPTAVTLVLSAPALVPQVDGVDAATLVASLGVLGADVELVTAYVPGAAAGTALSITPAPGEPLPTHVTLTVAEASSSIYLDDLDIVDGQCSSTSAQLNGVTYANSLGCSADADGKETSWVVSRVADSLEATVGVSDDGDPTARVRVEVLADGVLVGSIEAGYGAPAALVAPVTGALRVTIRTTLLGADLTSWNSENAILGDVRVVGGADAITVLDS